MSNFPSDVKPSKLLASRYTVCGFCVGFIDKFLRARNSYRYLLGLVITSLFLSIRLKFLDNVYIEIKVQNYLDGWCLLMILVVCS